MSEQGKAQGGRLAAGMHERDGFELATSGLCEGAFPLHRAPSIPQPSPFETLALDGSGHRSRQVTRSGSEASLVSGMSSGCSPTRSEGSCLRPPWA